MTENGQCYTLTGQDIYRPITIPAGLFLYNLNRSRSWRDMDGLKQGYAEGYLVEGESLVAYQYEIRDGRRVNEAWGSVGKWGQGDLRECRVEIDVMEIYG